MLKIGIFENNVDWLITKGKKSLRKNMGKRKRTQGFLLVVCPCLFCPLTLYSSLWYMRACFQFVRKTWLQNKGMELNQSGSLSPVIILSGNPFLKCILLKTDYDSLFPFSHDERMFQKHSALKLWNFLLNFIADWLINHFWVIYLLLEQLKMLLPSLSGWLTFLCTCRKKSSRVLLNWSYRFL